MSNQRKSPLPNAFEQARNTGKIGGTGKGRDLDTDTGTHKTINTEIQTSAHEPMNPETRNTEGRGPISQIQGTQTNLSQQFTPDLLTTSKGEEIKKQTIDLPKSLARRVKNHATNRDEKIRDVHIRALEKLLAEEGG